MLQMNREVPFPLFIHFCLARLGELCIMPLSSFFALPAFFHPAEGKSGVEETVTDAQSDGAMDGCIPAQSQTW